MNEDRDLDASGAADDLPTSDGKVGLLVSEMQLLLSEKRTALAVMRTGIAIFALPLSVLSVLIATSKHYEMSKVMPLLIPALAINAGLVALGAYLVVRALKKLHLLDRLISSMKAQSRTISDLIT